MSHRVAGWLRQVDDSATVSFAGFDASSRHPGVWNLQAAAESTRATKRMTRLARRKVPPKVSLHQAS